MLEIFPPVTRPRMFDVAKPESFRKFAMLVVGMLNCVWPLGRVTGGLTCVLRPDAVMGEAAWARKVRCVNSRTSEKPNARQEINLAYFAFKAEPPLGVLPSPRKD